jgi:chromosome partitioning protein
MVEAALTRRSRRAMLARVKGDSPMGFTYSTSLVARLAGVTPETVVDWIREGYLSDPPRNERNRRVFSTTHVSRALDLAGLRARRCISVVNQKGGVGKTTTVFNLAACLAYRGRRVLAVDLDAQANLTTSFGIDPDEIPLSSEDLLTNDSVTLEQVVRRTSVDGLDLVPADIRLAGADVKLREMIMREKILAGKLEDALDLYDFVLYDCPPNLSTITINALVASTDALIPMETQCYSFKAFQDLSRTLDVLRSRMCHEVRIWVLPTKIDRRIALSTRLLETIRETLGGKVLPPVRTDASVMKAPMIQEPVIFSFPRSRAAADYHAVCREVLSEATEIE